MAVILFLRYRRRTILPLIPFFSKTCRTVTAFILFLGYTHHAMIKVSVIPFFFERYSTVTAFVLFLGYTHNAVIKLFVIPFFFEMYHTVTAFILFLGYRHHAVIKLSVSRFSLRGAVPWRLLSCLWFTRTTLWANYLLYRFLWEVPYRDGYYPVSGLRAPRRLWYLLSRFSLRGTVLLS